MKAIFTLLLSALLSSASIAQDKIDLLFRSEKILAAGDTARALDAFSEILRIYPQSFAAALRLAEINFAKGDYFNAIQYSNVALDIAGNFVDSKSKSLRVLGLEADNSDQYRKFITDQAYVHHLKGTIRVRQNRPLDAEYEFRRSLGINPNSSRVMLDLAVLLSDQGRYEETKMLLKNAIVKTPTDIAPRMNLASLYNNLGKQDSAILYYKEVIKIDSIYKWAHLGLGNIYASQKDFNKSVASYSSYIAIDSTSEEAYYRRATSFMELKKFERAINDWSQLILLSKTDPEHYRNRGLTYFQLGVYDEAIKDFRQALTLAPEQTYTQINLGYSLYLTGESKEALKEISAGLETAPNYALGHYFLALAYYQLRKRKASCRALDEAIRLGLKDEDIDERLIKKCF